MYPGRSREIKEAFAEKLKKLTVEELGCEPGHVSVSIEDVPKNEWKEKVSDKMEKEDLIIKPNFE